MLAILVFDKPRESLRKVCRIVRKYDVVALVVIVDVENPRQLGALVSNYGAKKGLEKLLEVLYQHYPS